MEYIRQLYQKPDALTWESFYKSVNAEFKKTQQQQLKLNEQKRKAKDEKERQRQLQLAEQEREKCEKEQLELQRKWKQEQEEAEKRERERVEEARCRAKEEREQQEKEAKESVEKIALSACEDFIDIDDDSDDKEEAEQPLVKPNGQPLLKDIKKEKDTETKPKSEEEKPKSDTIHEKTEILKKIYDVNEQDYRIAVKNYDLNKEIENYLDHIGTLIVHPDIVYALQNLQKIGAAMRKQDVQTPAQETITIGASSNVPLGTQRPRNLFPEDTQNMDIDKVASEIKQENGSVHGEVVSDVVNPALNSPPPTVRMFPGMKRHTPQSFSEVISTKKRKVSTPARKNIGSPVVSPH